MNEGRIWTCIVQSLKLLSLNVDRQTVNMTQQSAVSFRKLHFVACQLKCDVNPAGLGPH